jgi:hypothetical protein
MKKFINLKRKKIENINKKDQKGLKIEVNINKENLNENLFDKNGSLILNHVKLNLKFLMYCIILILLILYISNYLEENLNNK